MRTPYCTCVRNFRFLFKRAKRQHSKLFETSLEKIKTATGFCRTWTETRMPHCVRVIFKISQYFVTTVLLKFIPERVLPFPCFFERKNWDGCLLLFLLKTFEEFLPSSVFAKKAMETRKELPSEYRVSKAPFFDVWISKFPL